MTSFIFALTSSLIRSAQNSKCQRFKLDRLSWHVTLAVCQVVTWDTTASQKNTPDAAWPASWPEFYCMSYVIAYQDSAHNGVKRIKSCEGLRYSCEKQSQAWLSGSPEVCVPLQRETVGISRITILIWIKRCRQKGGNSGEIFKEEYGLWRCRWWLQRGTLHVSQRATSS